MTFETQQASAEKFDNFDDLSKFVNEEEQSVS